MAYHALDGISDIADHELDNDADLLVGCVFLANGFHNLVGLNSSRRLLTGERRDLCLGDYV
jgi:hypothetical protein